MKSIFSELNPNQKEVLNLIRTHKELSGADISRNTNLQPSTIVYILKALTEYNLIEFSKTGESTNKGGKKPTLYKINADVGYIFGLEILLHKIKLVVIDFAGDTIVMQEEEYPGGLYGDKLINEIDSIIDRFTKSSGLDKKKIIGIGVAIPGIVSSRKGLIYFSRKLGIENVSLKQDLEKRLGIYTVVGNNANAGVLGFRWFPEKGDGQFSNMIYLVYNQESVNIGSGILINNQLYEGISGGAGEILTNLPSISDLISSANQSLKPENSKDKLHPSLSLEDIINRTKQNNTAALQVVETLCQRLADQIISIIALMNPHAIIVGGDLADYSNIVDNKIAPYVKLKVHESLKYGFEMPVIKTSRFGNFSVAIGASAMVLNEYYIMKKED